MVGEVGVESDDRLLALAQLGVQLADFHPKIVLLRIAFHHRLQQIKAFLQIAGAGHRVAESDTDFVGIGKLVQPLAENANASLGLVFEKSVVGFRPQLLDPLLATGAAGEKSEPENEGDGGGFVK